MDLNQKITISDTVYSQEVDDEMVLLDMTSENYFGLDAVGSDIWQLLHDGKTLQEAQDALFEMYDVDPKVLVKDFLDFVKKLKESGLVKIG
ncbi:MAG: PqqD family protein [Thermodesulfobacteriota bacterium]|nr:PqqD family protein [Thermodesulfobacteriota bacterium]